MLKKINPTVLIFQVVLLSEKDKRVVLEVLLDHPYKNDQETDYYLFPQELESQNNYQLIF